MSSTRLPINIAAITTTMLPILIRPTVIAHPRLTALLVIRVRRVVVANDGQGNCLRVFALVDIHGLIGIAQYHPPYLRP